jgi:hypothetical protein
MDVLSRAGDRRGYVAYPEKHNRRARVEDAEVAIRKGEGEKRQKDPDVKPTVGFTLPRWSTQK